MKSHPFRRPQPLPSSIAALCIALSASMISHRAHSANYNWDSNSATPGISDGGGIWNPTDSTWVESGSNKPWLNGNTAVFGAGVDGNYPIAVAFDPSATGLIFNNSGYTLSSGDLQTITVTSATSISVATGKTATIGGNLLVTSGTTASAITGGGTLVIENGGTVQNGGATSSIVMRIMGTAGGGAGTTVDLKPGGTLSNNLNNTAVFVSGALLVNGGTLNLAFTSTGGTLGLGQDASDSAGTITLNDGFINAPSTNGVRFGSNSGSTPGGTLNLNGGELSTRKLHKGTGTVATSVVNLNGSTLRATANDATFMEGLSRVNVRNGGAIIDTAYSITIKQDLLHSNVSGDNAIDGGLTKQGSGTLILTGTNSYTGNTNLLGGTLSISDETRLGDAANKLNFNGGNLQVTGTAISSLTRSFTWGDAGGGFDISAADNVFTLNQQLASGGGLLKRGAGTLILGGNNAYTGVTVLSAGVLQLTNGNSVGTSSISGTAPSSSQLQFATGMTLSNPVRLVGAGLNNDGALKVLSGNVTLTDFGVNANNGTRLHIVNGASLTITNDLVLGDGAAAQSLRIIGSGALELHGDSTLVLTTSGASMLLGDGVNAGPTIKAGNNLAFGLGTINFQPNSGSTLQSKDGTAHTFANPIAFNGASAVLGATGTGDLTFTGDVTLGADLGVSINNSVTTFTNVIADGGAARGLTKAGPGTLILEGANSYTGSTTVDAGSLLVNGSISGSNVVVNSGATLGGSGVVGAVDLLGGIVAPGNGPGTLSTNSFSLDSTATIKFELAQAGVTGGGINDLVSIAGNLTLDGTLQVTPLSGFGSGTYPLFTYTGTLTDSGLALDSAFLALYHGSSISTATPGVVGLVVVPEPTTGAFLMISLGVLAGCRRNRKHSRATF